jgi:hypothetical protein
MGNSADDLAKKTYKRLDGLEGVTLRKLRSMVPLGHAHQRPL